MSNQAYAIGQVAALVHVGTKHSSSMELVSPSSCDENAYKPAESVQIWGLDAICRLRLVCDETINAVYAANPELTRPTPTKP